MFILCLFNALRELELKSSYRESSGSLSERKVMFSEPVQKWFHNVRVYIRQISSFTAL